VLLETRDGAIQLEVEDDGHRHLPGGPGQIALPRPQKHARARGLSRGCVRGSMHAPRRHPRHTTRPLDRAGANGPSPCLDHLRNPPCACC
jgi:hypothetical protein